MEPVQMEDDAPNPYAKVWVAVSFVEECLMPLTPSDGTHLPGKNPWERMVALATERKGSAASPVDVAAIIKSALLENLNFGEGSERVIPLAMAQCDDSLFVQYIAGKMGAM